MLQYNMCNKRLEESYSDESVFYRITRDSCYSGCSSDCSLFSWQARPEKAARTAGKDRRYGTDRFHTCHRQGTHETQRGWFPFYCTGKHAKIFTPIQSLCRKGKSRTEDYDVHV